MWPEIIIKIQRNSNEAMAAGLKQSSSRTHKSSFKWIFVVKYGNFVDSLKGLVAARRLIKTKIGVDDIIGWRSEGEAGTSIYFGEFGVDGDNRNWLGDQIIEAAFLLCHRAISSVWRSTWRHNFQYQTAPVAARILLNFQPALMIEKSEKFMAVKAVITWFVNECLCLGLLRHKVNFNC